MSQQARPILVLPYRAVGDVTYARAIKFVDPGTPSTLAASQSGVAGERVHGIAARGTLSGIYGDAVTHGTATVESGGPVTAGASVQVDAVGRAVIADLGVVFGTALQAATAAGQYIEVLLG